MARYGECFRAEGIAEVQHRGKESGDDGDNQSHQKRTLHLDPTATSLGFLALVAKSAGASREAIW